MSKPSLRSRITGKINDYRRRDLTIAEKFPKKNIGLKTITSNEGLELVQKFGKTCPGCDCKMKFRGYGPWCLYQFTFDKIDDEKIHDKSNLVLACYSCNASGYGVQKTGCVKCPKGVHAKNELICKSWKEKIIADTITGKQINMKLLPRSKKDIHSRWRYAIFLVKKQFRARVKKCILI